MQKYLVLVLMAVGFSAKAETILVQCEPIYFKNAASISAYINVEKQSDGTLKSTANIKALVRVQNNTAQQKTLSAENMSGHLVEANALPDAQGQVGKFRTFFGAANGDMTQAKLSFGSATGMTANSYVVDKDGVYYFAKCTVQ